MADAIVIFGFLIGIFTIILAIIFQKKFNEVWYSIFGYPVGKNEI
jgi:hypothetical protein